MKIGGVEVGKHTIAGGALLGLAHAAAALAPVFGHPELAPFAQALEGVGGTWAIYGLRRALPGIVKTVLPMVLPLIQSVTNNLNDGK